MIFSRVNIEFRILDNYIYYTFIEWEPLDGNLKTARQTGDTA